MSEIDKEERDRVVKTAKKVFIFISIAVFILFLAKNLHN